MLHMKAAAAALWDTTQMLLMLKATVQKDECSVSSPSYQTQLTLMCQNHSRLLFVFNI